MAKADFCFTYYDGDAARDMAHMNRLERGAYSDIIISQRKFGHLTKDQIKKILGKDFDECFGSIELVLKRTDKGLFFIDWLDQSEKKAKLHSKRQSDNRNGTTKQQPNNNQTEPNALKIFPLEDGNEDGVVNEDWIKWSDQILNGENILWDKKGGINKTKEEMAEFLSVAVRNKWSMDTEMAFIISLEGFKSINYKSNGKSGVAKIIRDQEELTALVKAKYGDKAN